MLCAASRDGLPVPQLHPTGSPAVGYPLTAHLPAVPLLQVTFKAVE